MYFLFQLVCGLIFSSASYFLKVDLTCAPSSSNLKMFDCLNGCLRVVFVTATSKTSDTFITVLLPPHPIIPLTPVVNHEGGVHLAFNSFMSTEGKKRTLKLMKGCWIKLVTGISHVSTYWFLPYYRNQR